MRPEEIAPEIRAIVDRAAGKAHSETGIVMATLAEVLTLQAELDRKAELPDPWGKKVFDQAPWCVWRAGISLGWDQWCVASITCYHGTYSGKSWGLNIHEAITNMLAVYKRAEHPKWCGKEFDAGSEVEPDWFDCELWEGHSGPHAIDDSDED